MILHHGAVFVLDNNFFSFMHYLYAPVEGGTGSRCPKQRLTKIGIASPTTKPLKPSIWVVQTFGSKNPFDQNRNLDTNIDID